MVGACQAEEGKGGGMRLVATYPVEVGMVACQDGKGNLAEGTHRVEHYSMLLDDAPAGDRKSTHGGIIPGVENGGIG